MRLRKILQRHPRLAAFFQAEHGTIAVQFALLLIPLLAFVGYGVDMSMAYRAKSAAQSALDEAALAAGRAAQLNPGTPTTSATAAATAYWNASAPSGVVGSSLSFSVDSTQKNFTLTATTWVQTPFMSILSGRSAGLVGAPGVCSMGSTNCLQIINTATATLGAGGTNIEIAMMLDLTGSMAGQRIAALIQSASDLVNTVLASNQSTTNVRIGLAPFAPAVNVGSSYFQAITGESLTQTVTNSCGWGGWGGWGRWGGGGCGTQSVAIDPCVVERSGSQVYTDAAPGSGSYLPSWYDVSQQTSGSCVPSAQLLPLTSDRNALLNEISNFQAGGSTAGQLGTAFAWYLLSPNWASVWGSASAPGPYSDLTATNSNGAPKLRKIAVLMTDGVYNTLQGTYYDDYSSQATTASNEALQLCTNMKAAGIEVYTVGFYLYSTDEINLLTNCATDSSHFYNATQESALLAAFRDIALKISSLRLTN